MKEKNQELTHLTTDEVKLTKTNYIIIIVPILLSIALVAGIAIYVFAVNTAEHKLKNYLSDHGYSCNNESCSINVDDDTETIDFKTGILTVSNSEYNYMINHNYVSYQDKTNELVCTYRGANYSFYKSIDRTLTTDTNCEVYIAKINQTIGKYKEIFDFASVDVNQLKK